MDCDYGQSKGGAAGLGSGAGGFMGYDAQTTLSNYQSNNITPAFVLGQPLTIAQPTGNSAGTATGLGSTVPGIPMRNWDTLPRIQSWSFGIERTIPWNILIDAEYVGTKSNHNYFGGDTYGLDHLPVSVANAFRQNPNAYLANAPIPTNIVNAVKSVTAPYSNGIWSGTWPAYNTYLPYQQYPNNRTRA